jgi:hypothetical protein
MLKYIIYVQCQKEDALKKVVYSNTANNTITSSPNKKKRVFGRLRFNGCNTRLADTHDDAAGFQRVFPDPREIVKGGF